MSLWVTDLEPLELRTNASGDDLDAVIQAVYKQVLGNAYVMDNERIVSAESYLLNGEITVREFVRSVALSALYRNLFFESSSPYRFVELNCKHLLGRAPVDQAEVSAHVQLYNSEGYEAEINSYLDSAEYLDTFGENIVPYCRANSQTGITNVTFNRGFALMRGAAAHDAKGKSVLVSDLGANLATKIKTPAGQTGTYDNTGKRFKITVSSSGASARLNRFGAQSYVVSYSQMSQKMQAIFKSGSKVLSVVEVS